MARNTKWISKECKFRHCLGTIDGKHVRIIKPQNSGSLYYNYKHFFSLQLLAMCDSNYCFTYVDVRDYGKNSDSSIFKNSMFYKKLSNNELDISNPVVLPGRNDSKSSYVIIGDEEFGLSFHVMRPYSGKVLSNKKRICNYRLSRARRYIECSFGILSNKWRIFHRPLNVSIDIAKNIVKACIVLHNFVRVRDGYRHEDTLSYEGMYDNDNTGIVLNNARSATTNRDYFADYFVNTNVLPGQNRYT